MFEKMKALIGDADGCQAGDRMTKLLLLSVSELQRQFLHYFEVASYRKCSIIISESRRRPKLIKYNYPFSLSSPPCSQQHVYRWCFTLLERVVF